MVSEQKVSNSCEIRKDFCPSCNNHFMELRPRIKEVVITRHFERDVKDKEEVDRIVKSVLECSHMEFTELHKFEENIDDNRIFRAKMDHRHIVYCIDRKMRIIFLRVIENFDVYKKFLEDKKKIKRLVESV